ncbi:MAG: exodeoxyribonuclease V subunit gamma [Sandaracinaceae bacterium]
MIHLTYSNRTEALLVALLRRLSERRRRAAAGQADPLAPVYIVVPNRNVERYVELGVARGLGVAANLRFERLGWLVSSFLGDQVLTEDALTARVLRALLDPELVSSPSLGPVRRYLGGAGEDTDAVERRRVQLALHVARLFEEYAFSRPELLDAWSLDEGRFAGGEHAETEAWQRAVFRHARGRAQGYRTLREAIEQAAEPPAPELHVFGLSYVARVFSEVFDAIGKRSQLYLYSLNPCEEFWEDVETLGELRRRRRTSDTEPEFNFDERLLEEEDPFNLSVDTETPLLRLWGRPGREHVRLLDALTDCDFDAAFSDPLAGASEEEIEAGPLFAGVHIPSLLSRIQHDVLARAPRPEAPPPTPRDGSIRVLACPSVRREVETVAAEVWDAIASIEGLTFDQIAVLVNGPDRDLYLPHVASVFAEARDIPYNVADLALASVSPVVEAALRLIALPGSRFARPDVLAVLTHPAVRPPDVDANDWVALVDRLGIFHGLAHEDHAGTYVGGRDLLSWDQGLRRIALGAFVDDPDGVSLDGQVYLPECSPPGDLTAARFAMQTRSLMADVAFARTARLPLKKWAAFFGALLNAHLRPANEAEAAALRRALAAFETLAQLDLDGTEVHYAVAHELAARQLDGLAGSRGQQLADGVAVSTLMPMRAIPFRVIFVLGLGEGRFPANDRRDSLDLRAARRRAGDVTPPERDRYTFLETLLCARDRLVLSYVARDERTGDALAPSAVVSELLEVVERSYLPDARSRLIRHPRLRRHEEEGLAEVLPSAGQERFARELGEALRGSLEAEGRSALLSTLTASETARRAAGNAPEAAPLRRALGLAVLPERSQSALEPVLRLSLAAIRRFLECPLQGWTRVVLRLDEEDFESAAALADEPFRPGVLDATVALRQSFVASRSDGADVEECYRAHVRRLAAKGRWPIGPLAAVEAAHHQDILAHWEEAWSALGSCTTGRLRLGTAHVEDGATRIAEPIDIRFDDDPRRPGSGTPLRVEISGRTELLCARAALGTQDGEASVLPLVRSRPGARGHVTELRHGLRGFLDHVALSALRPTDAPAVPHRAVALYGDLDAPRVRRFRPVATETARCWLRDVIEDLIASPHAYLLPIEAVLRTDDLSGPTLVDSVEYVRDRWDGGQSRYGPVRDALRYPVPEPGPAEAVVARRFGLFFDSLEAP